MGRPSVSLCASGILIRASAPRLSISRPEPALVEMPEGEVLERLAATGATWPSIWRSPTSCAPCARSRPDGVDYPVIVACRVSWLDELLLRGTRGDIRDQVKEARITRSALILVDRALAGGVPPRADPRPPTTIT
jgi:precorrin-4/cobalt-precorrin-4 C11-methyltransferase